MPLLNEQDQKTMLGFQPWTCSKCNLHPYKNYCRQCDEFFYQCGCGDDNEDAAKHKTHRQYPFQTIPTVLGLETLSLDLLARLHKKPYTPEDVWCCVWSLAPWLAQLDPLKLQDMAEFHTRYLTAESAKTEPLRDEWKELNIAALDGLPVGGHISEAHQGVIYQRTEEKTLKVVAELPSYQGSRTQIINDRCMEALGMTMERPADVVQTPEQFLKTIARLSPQDSFVDVTWLLYWREMEKRAADLKARS